MPPPILSITDTAAQEVRRLLAGRKKPSAGVRVGVRTRGCSGLSYTLEYADEPGEFDEVVDIDAAENEDTEDGDAFRIFIDPKAVMFVLGTEMDYVEEKFKSGFVFHNPNEKGRCGCGESFHV